MKKINSKKRKIVMKTAHGKLQTPIFLPDATRAFVKQHSSDELRRAGVKAMVVNTFHLYLQPGIEIIKKAGGVHKFMNWKGPLISDSGGFQVFSLVHQNSKMGKITDEGVTFKSPLDGSMHFISPEKSIQIQFDLGVDAMVCFDDCPPNDAGETAIKASVERTILWAKRCRKEYDRQVKKRKFTSTNPLIFGVIQGGNYKHLREYCAQNLYSLDFDGYGFGARPVDSEGNFLEEILEFTASLIPADKLRFNLGMGTPEDIRRSYAMGWDIFDCVIPSREGRHGRLFASAKRNNKSKILNSKYIMNSRFHTFNINNTQYSKDFSAINADSGIKELREYSKAFLHHLFKLKEPLGMRLASLNNLEFYQKIIKEL